MGEVRTISHLLHPPLLDEVGIGSAIQWYVQQFGERSKINVVVDVPQSLGRFPPDLETAIFRIVQECLTNVHRHSASPTATVRIVQDRQNLCLEIRDSGKGIPSEKRVALTSGKSGVGLCGMQERANQLGGSLDIQSNGSGTVVTAIFPIPPLPADTSNSVVV